MAEYEVLLSGLHIAIELGVKRIDVRGDSRLVTEQVMKESSCHDSKMEAYCNAVHRLEDKFDGLELNHIPRKYNEDTDELVRLCLGGPLFPRTSLHTTSLNRPSISRIRQS